MMTLLPIPIAHVDSIAYTNHYPLKHHPEHRFLLLYIIIIIIIILSNPSRVIIQSH